LINSVLRFNFYIFNTRWNCFNVINRNSAEINKKEKDHAAKKKIIKIENLTFFKIINCCQFFFFLSRFFFLL